MVLLSSFLKNVLHDPRIGPSHISMYVAFLQIREDNENREPIIVTREQVMSLARIGATSTYHRILKDLTDQGYVKYEGRHDRKGSKVYLRRDVPSEIELPSA